MFYRTPGLSTRAPTANPNLPDADLERGLWLNAGKVAQSG